MRIYLDNSYAGEISKCDLRGYLKAHALSPVGSEESIKPRAGSDIHEGLARYYKTGSRKKALGRFRKLYAPFAEEWVESDSAYSFENLRLILQSAMSEFTPESLPVEPERVEVPFEIPMFAPGMCICGHTQKKHLGKNGRCDTCTCPAYTELFATGQMDVLGPIRRPGAKGALAPLDWKTTGWLTAPWVSKWEIVSQLSHYIWAAQQETGQEISEAFIGAIEIKVVPSSASKCREHGVAYEECGRHHLRHRLIGPIYRRPDQIEAWRRGFVAQAAKLRDLLVTFGYTQGLSEDLPEILQTGTFNESCQFCSFGEFCLTSRSKEQAEAMLTPQPWRHFRVEV